MDAKDLCIKCGTSANLMCARCFDRYCGTVCQQSDWPQHKKNCPEMPALVPILKCSSNAPKVNIQNKQQEQIMEKVLFLHEPGISPPVEKVPKTDETEPSKISKASLKVHNQQETGLSKNFYFSDLEIKPLPEGKNIKLIVTDASFVNQSILAVSLFDYAQQKLMMKNFKKLSNYCKGCPVTKRGYKPQYNEICLAIFQNDKKWYRAKCIDMNGDDTFTLQFIDFGNMSEVHRNEIMPINEELMFPCYNNFCLILNDIQKIPKLKATIKTNPIIECETHFADSCNIYKVFINNLD